MVIGLLLTVARRGIKPIEEEDELKQMSLNKRFGAVLEK